MDRGLRAPSRRWLFYRRRHRYFEVPHTRVGEARSEGSLPQTIRAAGDEEGMITSLVVREHDE